MDTDTEVIVIDSGSRYFKAGFAGEDGPRAVVPAVVGRNRLDAEENNEENVYVGDEVENKIDVLSVTSPIEYGIVLSWEDLEIIWHHVFYKELRIAPEEHIVLLTQPPLNPKANKERMTRIMFETFKVSGLLVCNQASLVLHSSGHHTGVVLHCGGSMTYAVPIYEGYPLNHAIIRSNVAGRDVSHFLLKLLIENECLCNLSSRSRKLITENIKESLCYVTQDVEEEYTKEGNRKKKSDYSFGDKVVELNDEILTCAEALFQPKMIGLNNPGVHEVLGQAIKNSDAEIQQDLYMNIMVSGGSSAFPGFVDRLLKELLIAASHSQIQIKKRPSTERKFLAWIGGSIYGSTTPSDAIITKDEYNRNGPKIIHEKFFSD